MKFQYAIDQVCELVTGCKVCEIVRRVQLELQVVSLEPLM
jgi:hypothetical protein